MFPEFPWLQGERQVGQHPILSRLVLADDRHPAHFHYSMQSTVSCNAPVAGPPWRPVRIRSRSLSNFRQGSHSPTARATVSAFTSQHCRNELVVVFCGGFIRTHTLHTSRKLRWMHKIYVLIFTVKSPSWALFYQCGLSRHTSQQSNPTPRENN